MSPGFVDKVFEPFAREHNDRTQNIQGTGLGLSITKSIVDIMQGNIEVKSKNGGGSRFEVTLRFRACEQSVKKAVEEEKVHVESVNNLKGHRLLLVEDNELNREIFIELMSDTGADIEIAVNGLEAVQRMEQCPAGYYDMIFMDVQMPVMDGYEATRRIRALGKGDGMSYVSTVPIIALTANAFSEDSDKAIRAGMNSHLSKPISIEKLMSVISRWLNDNK